MTFMQVMSMMSPIYTLMNVTHLTRKRMQPLNSARLNITWLIKTVSW